jgi:hypothetical protein
MAVIEVSAETPTTSCVSSTLWIHLEAQSVRRGCRLGPRRLAACRPSASAVGGRTCAGQTEDGAASGANRLRGRLGLLVEHHDVSGLQVVVDLESAEKVLFGLLAAVADDQLWSALWVVLDADGQPERVPGAADLAQLGGQLVQP